MRISRDQMLMDMAVATSKRGTCSRLQVGSVISRDGRVISTGYNGAPSGIDHCEHPVEKEPHRVQDERPVIEGRADLPFVRMSDGLHPNRHSHHRPSGPFELYPGRVFSIAEPPASTGCDIAEHSERNAIAYAARYGVALDGSEMHCTHSPCLNCARMIINAGIKRLTYLTAYRITEGMELLARAGVEVIDFEAQGKVV